MADYDASQAGSNNADTGPTARPDVDSLPAGSMGPASGNTITGAGTITGQSGADTPGAGGASVVEVHGAGGATSGGAGNFQASGQYGVLSMDAQGNYNYVRNPGTPDGVRDVFQYTLADAQGANSATTLTIDIGQVLTANAGIVNLPAGVELSDIHVVGRDLVIDMPDGTHMVIPNGAVFVPQLSIGDVAVPASNVAALLIDSEPQPAAGNTPSSGGNFADPVPPLDPGVPLGDLIPPTELTYHPPDFKPEGQFIDTEPTVVIVTPDNPAGAIDAHDQVDEAGLPARTIDGVAEPQGSDSAANSEQTSGTIVFEAKDGLQSVTVNGTVITADSVGDTITGEFGTLTITSVNLAAGTIGYTYAISDNTDPGGNGNADHFTVAVTDTDGDVATGTLTVDIIDDTPTARNDTDSVDVVSHQAAGNVITAVGTTNSGADTVGADDAHITGLSSNNVSGHSDSDASGGFVVDGEFGTLTMDANGQYTYVLHDNAPGGSVDVFTYTLTDGDGDPSTATLTINNPDRPVQITNLTPAANGGDVIVDEDDLQNGSDTSKESTTVAGSFNISAPDGVASLTVGGVNVVVDGVFQVGAHINTPLGNTLTFTGYNAATGEITYTYTLNDNTLTHDNSGQDSVFENFTVVLTDTDGDTDSDTLSVNIVDDVPTAHNDADALVGNDLDETGNVITGVGTTGGPGGSGVDVLGADGAHVTAIQGADGTDTSFENGVLTIHGAHGTLTIDANGEYTYVRDADSKEAGTDTFTYTLTDGDGDQSQATLTITLPDINSVPEIGRAASLSVDEDGLPAGNSDEGQVNPTEADHGGNVTDSSTVVVDFGNDRPANTADAIEFVNPSSLNGQLTQNGEPITFSIDGSGNLIGQVNGTGPAVVTISFTTAVNGSGGTVTYGYQVTLSDNVDQAYPNGDQLENGITLTGVQFNVTDSDGEHAATPGSFDVVIYDDVPSAEDITVTQDPENSAVTVALAGHYTPGADGVDLHDVTYNVTEGNAANLSYNGNTGQFTYTPSAGEEGDVVFTYTITDGDGDDITKTITIHLAPDSTPQVGAAPTLTVDEDGLSNANADNSQTNPTEANHGGNVTDSDTVVVDFGNDRPASPGDAIEFINASALDGQLTQDGDPITFSINGSGDIIGQVNGTGPAVVTISLTTAVNGTGGTVTYGYSVTLAGPVDQAFADQLENGITLTGVQFQVTDSDGDVSAPGSFNVTIYDDVPSAENFAVTQSSEDAAVTANISTHIVPGADGVDLHDVTHTAPTGTGSLSYDGDTGIFTYTPSAGETGDVTFDYTVVDADGDHITKTITIHLGPDSVPQVGTIANASVDEDGLANANADNSQVNPTEANHGGNLTDSHTFNVDFGSDRPATPANAIVFLDNASLDTQLTQNGQPITFSIDGSGHLIGQVNGTGPAVVTIAITSAVNGSGGNVTYGYTVTLAGHVDQAYPNGDQTEAGVTLNGVQIQVTDSDGSTGSGSFNVTIYDDVPSVDVAGATTVVEGATANGTWTEVIGADTPGATVVIFNSTEYALGSAIDTGKGTLTVNANGTWSFQANNNIDNTIAQSISFSVKVTDSDGDHMTDTQTVSITDGAGPGAGGTVNLTVNEFALDTTKDATDLQAGISTGTNASATSETQVVAPASGLHFTTGSDSLTSVAFNSDASALSGIVVSGLQGTQSITWSISGGQLIGTLHEGATNLGTAIIVALTGDTGATAQGGTANVGVTATLVGPLDHTNTTITLNGIDVIASQADGDVGHGTVNVTVSDDVPLAVHAAAITSGLSNGGGDSATANLDGGSGGNSVVSDNMGADGGKVIFTAATITSLQGQNLSHDGAALSYLISPDGQTLTGYVDANHNSTVDANETVLTIQLQPSGSPNDYTVTMVQSVDVLQNIDFNGGGYNFVGGNGSWAGFTSGTNGDGIVDLLLTPMVNGVNASTMNTNANEGGVGSGNSVSFGEGVRVDTVQDLQAVPAPTPSGDYGLLANENHVFGQHQNVIGISAVISTVNGPPGSTTDVQLIARDEAGASDTNDLVGDGAVEAITSVVITHGTDTETVLKSAGTTQDVTVDGHVYTVTFGSTDATVTSITEGTRIGATTADGFDSLEIRNVGGQEFKIGDFNTLAVTNGPKDITVPISVVDGDGDQVSSGNLAIHVDGSTSNSAAVVNTLMATNSLASTSNLSSDHLVSTNDNHRAFDNHRSFDEHRSANSAALLGAIAAAGLSSAHEVAAEGFHGSPHAVHSGPIMAPQMLSSTHVLARDGGGHEASVQPTHVVADAQLMSTSHLSSGSDGAKAHGFAGQDHGGHQAAMQLAHGTEAHVMSHGPAPLTAASIAMPSAQMLAAHMGVGKGGAAEAQNATDVQSNAVVGKVLADSLAGGHGHGPNIDALLHNAAGHGHGQDALAALASHDAPAVSFGHSGVFAGFHNAPVMEHMMMHQDAAPVHN